MAVAPEVEQYLEAFLLEAREELTQIQACLEHLHKEGAKLALVEDAARATANLKSAAATMGFRSVRDLAHATWDMLNAWRRGSVKDPAVSLQLLVRSHRRLDEIIKMLRDGRGPETSVADLTLQLRALVTEDAENPWPEAEPRGTKDATEHRFIVKLSLETPCPHPVGRFLVCQGYLLELGRVLASDPPPAAEDASEGLSLRFLLVTTHSAAEVRHTVEAIPHVRKVEVNPATPELDALPPTPRERKRSVFYDLPLAIEARCLDELDEIAAELAQIRSGYRAIEHEVERVSPGLSFRLSRLGDRLEYPERQLSDLVAQLRHIPAELLLAKLTRFALEQAKEAGRELEVRTVGGDIAISIDQAEVLFGPLQRLVCVLVEWSALAAADRLEAGQAKASHLEFSVQQGEAKIVLGLAVDGAALDLEKELKPGGSLAEARRMLESRGCVLDGQSWPEQGTLLHVEIAPPGAQIDVLALQLGKDLFALSLSEVMEARRAADETVARIDGRRYLSQGREMVPLYDLASLLGKAPEDTGGFWLFVRIPGQSFILRVPIVLGSRRVTAKPGPTGLKIPGLAGACADSSGRIYFLLSAEQLARLAGATGRSTGKKGREAKA